MKLDMTTAIIGVGNIGSLLLVRVTRAITADPCWWSQYRTSRPNDDRDHG
jgi:hypothetical protein